MSAAQKLLRVSSRALYLRAMELLGGGYGFWVLLLAKFVEGLIL